METNKRKAGKGKCLVRNQEGKHSVEGIVLTKQRNFKEVTCRFSARTTDESEMERWPSIQKL